MVKRAFDFTASLVGLVVLVPVLAAIAVMIRQEDAGPIFYRGLRVGQHGRPFRIFKFRTMVLDAEKLGGPSTTGDDPRLTKVGRFLRKYKLDELPQLIDVLTGEMSLVGPRPEVPQYVALFTPEERDILSVRPGITDWASLWNSDEAAVLAGSPDPERTYLEQIRPEKLRLQLEYVHRRSFWVDLAILAQTVLAIILRRKAAALNVQQRNGDREMGVVTEACMEVGTEGLLRMYQAMLRIRIFEERVAELVEAGEIKTPCHLSIGQEAVAAGVCAALEREDYVWGGHRSHGHYLAKGGDLKAMLAEIYGKATGCARGRGGSMHLVAPECGIYGTVPLVTATVPLAVGTGLASKLRGDRTVSVSFFGDGATDEGHFHESVNLAALYRLPVMFVCENNFYSSHMPLLERRAKDNIVQVSDAHGIPGFCLDGNDVVVVYQAAAAAVGRARDGGGPTLLECRTYRWRGHVGPSWDMDVGVKRKDELKDWLPKDPIKRLGDRLRGRGIGEAFFERLEQEIRDEVDAAVAFARESPFPDPSELHRNVFTSENGGA